MVPRFDHITPVLQELHWLPVVYRIQFKILLLVFKAIHGMAPEYITDMIIPKSSGGYFLRSNSQYQLVVPRSKHKYFGDRAFAVCAPTLWNKLPLEIKLSSNVDQFKSKLKTHFFLLAYMEFMVVLAISATLGFRVFVVLAISMTPSAHYSHMF